MWWYMISQGAMGAFLKMHVMEGTLTRRMVVKAHSVVGKTFPVFGWMMAVFGIIAMNGVSTFTSPSGHCPCADQSHSATAVLLR
jgi:hypothetical protein